MCVLICASVLVFVRGLANICCPLFYLVFEDVWQCSRTPLGFFISRCQWYVRACFAENEKKCGAQLQRQRLPNLSACWLAHRPGVSGDSFDINMYNIVNDVEGADCQKVRTVQVHKLAVPAKALPALPRNCAQKPRVEVCRKFHSWSFCDKCFGMHCGRCNRVSKALYNPLLDKHIFGLTDAGHDHERW
jgi:hypothetical protein